MNIASPISALKSAFSSNLWTDDQDIIAPHLSEWRDSWVGTTPLMLTPRSTEDTAKIVKLCAQHKIPLTVQGGNTGLVGAQIPQGEVLLSTKFLNQVRSVSTQNMAMTCEAGVTLAQAQFAAAEEGVKFPLSLASEGSCTIGGNLSTNAGGVHVVKYGTAKELVFGVEAVLANGDIYNGLTSLRKDNTGYDLSRLLLGAEGTLGIITAASLRLFPKPTQTVRVMAALRSPKHAQALLETSRIGTHLTMFELVPRIGIESVLKFQPSLQDPFTQPYPWYALIDWEFNDLKTAEGFAERALSSPMENGTVLDAVIASNETQAANLLALREHMSAAQKPLGYITKFDITVPLSRTAEFIETANAAMQKIVPDCRTIPFGHLGDGNIHYNVAQPTDMGRDTFKAFEPKIIEAVYDIIDSMGGSISAEHGIGIMKKEELQNRASPVKMAMLRSIKAALDPDKILNPRVLI